MDEGRAKRACRHGRGGEERWFARRHNAQEKTASLAGAGMFQEALTRQWRDIAALKPRAGAISARALNARPLAHPLAQSAPLAERQAGRANKPR